MDEEASRERLASFITDREGGDQHASSDEDDDLRYWQTLPRWSDEQGKSKRPSIFCGGRRRRRSMDEAFERVPVKEYGIMHY